MLYLEPIQVFDEVRRQLLGCHSNNFQQTVHSFLAYKTKQQKSNIAWKGYQDPHLVSYTFLSRCSPLSWSQDFNIFCCSSIYNSSCRLVACPHAPTIQFTRVILNSLTSHPAVQLWRICARCYVDSSKALKHAVKAARECAAAFNKNLYLHVNAVVVTVSQQSWCRSQFITKLMRVCSRAWLQL